MGTHLTARCTPIAGLCLALAGLALPALSCAPEDDGGQAPPAEQAENRPNTLTEREQRDGWRLLFDGETFAGWRGLGRETIPEGHWILEDGTIRKVASGDVPTAPDGQPLEGGDLMTTEAFDNFELTLEWKISPAGNSGIKYNVSEELSTAHPPPYAALGFEYQVLDDARHPDGEDPTHRTAALYDMIAPGAAKRLRPVGTFNETRLVFRDGRGEHWLNGAQVVTYELGTPRFDSLLAASKYQPIAGFAERRRGHLVLQDHGDDAWFRNIKIRTLPPP